METNRLAEAVIFRKVAQLDKELMLDKKVASSVPSASGRSREGGGRSVRPGLETQL